MSQWILFAVSLYAGAGSPAPPSPLNLTTTIRSFTVDGAQDDGRHLSLEKMIGEDLRKCLVANVHEIPAAGLHMKVDIVRDTPTGAARVHLSSRRTVLDPRFSSCVTAALAGVSEKMGSVMHATARFAFKRR